MSTRERWIVYPLLFLTLGIALRDKIIPPAEVRVGEVICDRLECGQSECRTLLIHGPSGRPVVVAGTDANTRAGVVETFTDSGMRQVQLHSTNTGGMVTTIGHAGKMALVLGDVAQNFGLFAELRELGQVVPLTATWRFGTKPALPQPPDKSAVPGQKPKEPSPPKAQKNP